MFTSEYLRELTNKAIASLGGTPEAERLFEPVRYILSIGGKRLRPVMCLLSCNIFSDKIDEALMPAVGIEVFHNFTLIHDDIMDGDVTRRGVPTVHTVWSEPIAILAGDVLYAKAFEFICLSNAGDLEKIRAVKMLSLIHILTLPTNREV